MPRAVTISIHVAVVLAVRAVVGFTVATSTPVIVCAAVALAGVALACAAHGWVGVRYAFACSAVVSGVALPVTSWYVYACDGGAAAGLLAASRDLPFLLFGVAACVHECGVDKALPVFAGVGILAVAALAGAGMLEVCNHSDAVLAPSAPAAPTAFATEEASCTVLSNACLLALFSTMVYHARRAAKEVDTSSLSDSTTSANNFLPRVYGGAMGVRGGGSGRRLSQSHSQHSGSMLGHPHGGNRYGSSPPKDEVGDEERESIFFGSHPPTPDVVVEPPPQPTDAASDADAPIIVESRPLAENHRSSLIKQSSAGAGGVGNPLEPPAAGARRKVSVVSPGTLALKKDEVASSDGSDDGNALTLKPLSSDPMLAGRDAVILGARPTSSKRRAPPRPVPSADELSPAMAGELSQSLTPSSNLSSPRSAGTTPRRRARLSNGGASTATAEKADGCPNPILLPFNIDAPLTSAEQDVLSCSTSINHTTAKSTPRLTPQLNALLGSATPLRSPMEAGVVCGSWTPTEVKAIPSFRRALGQSTTPVLSATPRGQLYSQILRQAAAREAGISPTLDGQAPSAGGAPVSPIHSGLPPRPGGGGVFPGAVVPPAVRRAGASPRSRPRLYRPVSHGNMSIGPRRAGSYRNLGLRRRHSSEVVVKHDLDVKDNADAATAAAAVVRRASDGVFSGSGKGGDGPLLPTEKDSIGHAVSGGHRSSIGVSTTGSGTLRVATPLGMAPAAHGERRQLTFNETGFASGKDDVGGDDNDSSIASAKEAHPFDEASTTDENGEEGGSDGQRLPLLDSSQRMGSGSLAARRGSRHLSVSVRRHSSEQDLPGKGAGGGGGGDCGGSAKVDLTQLGEDAVSEGTDEPTPEVGPLVRLTSPDAVPTIAKRASPTGRSSTGAAGSSALSPATGSDTGGAKWTDFCNDGNGDDDRPDERSFAIELRQVWNVFDKDCTGYLSLSDVQSLLEVIGVEAQEADYEDFLDMANNGGLCERDIFVNLYEEFRLGGAFEAFFGRVHLAALASSLTGSSVQQRVIQALADITDSDMLSRDVVFEVLSVLGLPCDDDDVDELFHEFSTRKGTMSPSEVDHIDVIETVDFIALFSCTHPAVTHTNQFTQKVQDACMVLYNLRVQSGGGKVVYATEEQLQQTKASEKRAEYVNYHWVVFVFANYSVVRTLYSCVFAGQSETAVLVLLLDVLSDIVFWLWVYEKLRYPEQEKGIGVEMSLEAILRHLRNPKHVLDLLIIIPCDWVGLIMDGRGYDPLLRVNKALLLFYLPTLFGDATRRAPPTTARIGGALYILTVQALILGCFFKLISDHVGDDDVYSTTKLLRFSAVSSFSQFFHSFDYAMKTMTGSVRGSEQTPVNDLQVAYAIVTVLSGVATYAFVLASISNALQIKTSASMFSDRMDEVKSFLSYYNIPEGLRASCVSYYHHIYRTTGTTQSDVIIDDLPHELEVRVHYVQVRDMLAKVPIFADAIVDDGFVYALSLKLRAGVLCPGEVVTEKGGRGSNMYFITHGLCNVVAPNGSVIVGLKKGSFFGEIALLHNVRRTATVVAGSYCNVLVLEKVDFDEVCEHYPMALEKIWEAAFDRIKVIVMEELKQNQEKLTNHPRRRSTLSQSEGAGDRTPERLPPHPRMSGSRLSVAADRRRSSFVPGSLTRDRSDRSGSGDGSGSAITREVTEQDVQDWIASRQAASARRATLTSNASKGSWGSSAASFVSRNSGRRTSGAGAVGALPGRTQRASIFGRKTSEASDTAPSPPPAREDSGVMLSQLGIGRRTSVSPANAALAAQRRTLRADFGAPASADAGSERESLLELSQNTTSCSAASPAEALTLSRRVNFPAASPPPDKSDV